jgi:hypothetical protein
LQHCFPDGDFGFVAVECNRTTVISRNSVSEVATSGNKRTALDPKNAALNSRTLGHSHVVESNVGLDFENGLFEPTTNGNEPWNTTIENITVDYNVHRDDNNTQSEGNGERCAEFDHPKGVSTNCRTNQRTETSSPSALLVTVNVAARVKATRTRRRKKVRSILVVA